MNSIKTAAPSLSLASPDPVSFAGRLLDWYDAHHRDLPWRISPAESARGVRPDPFRVWLSEIMLQQTTVAAVKSYFEKFVINWPDVAALAAASDDDIMKAWAGLGYYSRARNLKACANSIMTDHGGVFPTSEAGLRALPGIGDYTAAAIAAIAFAEAAAVVDGNVERVMTRHRAIATPLPKAKAEVKAVLGPLVPRHRPGDFAQAMMDLGATLCTPKRPACALCPLRDDCAALARGIDPEFFPVKPAKAKKPQRAGAAFVAIRADGAILLERRPDKGLLGGMAGVPTTNWTVRGDGGTGANGAPFGADWRETGAISHVFTHFELRLTVWLADLADHQPKAGQWWSQRELLHGEALPTVMKKVLESAVPGATQPPDKETQ